MQFVEQVLDSREVAEMVGKKHNELLKDIRRYVEQLSLGNLPQSDFFMESKYKTARGKEYPCYLVTKKGCEFIAHKLTGQKGTEFTARYINRFHEMQDIIRRREAEPKLPQIIRIIQDLQVVEMRGIRVLTTKQIAEAYGADIKTIQYNFRYNKARYELGVHYIEVKGDELRRLKTTSEIHSSLKYAKRIYLWTEKGALLHAKSLNTDKAWEVYDYLVDFYFRAKSEQKAIPAVHTEESPKAEKEPYDIAPLFREVITYLPLEALDAMEKSLRSGTSKAMKLAGMSVLAEKMKRQMA